MNGCNGLTKYRAMQMKSGSSAAASTAAPALEPHLPDIIHRENNFSGYFLPKPGIKNMANGNLHFLVAK